jgi:hypothetical protein
VTPTEYVEVHGSTVLPYLVAPPVNLVIITDQAPKLSAALSAIAGGAEGARSLWTYR